MKDSKKPYAMGGNTDALSVAPTANYSGKTFIQDMSEALSGKPRRNKTSNKHNKSKR